MFFDETHLAYQTKTQSTALKMIASVSPHLVSVVYYYPEYFVFILILIFIIINWSCRSPLKKNSNLNRNIIKKNKNKINVS
jgi:hypothetical protein